MIYSDGFGYLTEIPDGQFADGLGDYGEVIYDRFGNSLGLPFVAALAPLAAKLIPAAAAVLPGLISKRRPAAPAPPPSPPLATPLVPFPPPAPPPTAPIIIHVPVPMPMMPPIPAPGARRFISFARRRRPRRRVPVRLQLREEVTASPTATVRMQPPAVSVSPPPSVATTLVPGPPIATESSGGMAGVFYGPFGFFE
jgi:hypothetical protein